MRAYFAGSSRRTAPPLLVVLLILSLLAPSSLASSRGIVVGESSSADAAAASAPPKSQPPAAALVARKNRSSRHAGRRRAVVAVLDDDGEDGCCAIATDSAGRPWTATTSLSRALRTSGGAAEEGVVDKSDTWDLSDMTAADFVYAGVHVAIMAGVAVACRKLPRTGGEAPEWVFGDLANPYATVAMHLAYFAIGLFALPKLLPEGLSRLVFSPPSVALLGFVFPAVESIRAAVTEGGSDDRTWLMFWVVQGIFQYSTEFMDQLALKYKAVYEYWHTFEVLAVVWLILPVTDGATLIYNTVARPYLLPLVKPLKSYCDGWIATLALTTINASYVYWFSFVFMSLPVAIKRYAVIGVGSVFPVVSTIMALASSKETREVMRWLTYWPCFSFLFLAMIGTEKFVGSFKGLYVVCLAATLYLMLPMFDGSMKVFRNVLVPLTGQQELLLIRDAHALAGQLLKKIPVDRQDYARQQAANAFAGGNGE